MNNIKRTFSALMAFIIAFTGLSGLSGEVKTMGAQYADISEYESLAELYSDYFKVGAVCGSVLNNNTKSTAVLNLFNSITCENEMKPEYNFSSTSETLYKTNSSATKMLDWAKKNGMQMRGHCLVWHSQVSPSFFAIDYKATCNGKVTTSYSDVLDEECLVDRDTLIERMRLFIYGTMEYIYSNGYGDVIYAWDVVNEAMDEGTNDSLRHSSWYRILGPDYLYYAFLFAREASVKYANEYAYLYGLDPATDDLSSIIPKLIYNDYNEWYSARVSAIIKYMSEYSYNEGQSMVKSSVIKTNGDGTIFGDGLIDGIGMQGHLSDTNDINSYINAIRKYDAAVGEVQITELDVGCTGSKDNKWYRQAKFYYDFFSALVEEVKNGVNLTSVTLWGLTDDTSWRSSSSPLLLNSDLSKKPAYNAVVMAGEGVEFDMTLAETTDELSDVFIDFEPYKENGTNVTFDPINNGFFSRGTGHQAAVTLKMKVNHTENAALGFSLLCNRKEQDASLKIDISKYRGLNLTVKMYVKTEDSKIMVGLDGDVPTELICVNSKADDWRMIMFNVDVPKADPEYLYVETDGSADFYLDDISFIYTKEGEEKPVIEYDEDVSDAETPVTEVISEPADNEKAEDSKAETSVATEQPVSENSSNVQSNNTSKLPAVAGIAAAVVLACGVVVYTIKKRKK